MESQALALLSAAVAALIQFGQAQPYTTTSDESAQTSEESTENLIQHGAAIHQFQSPYPSGHGRRRSHLVGHGLRAATKL